MVLGGAVFAGDSSTGKILQILRLKWERASGKAWLRVPWQLEEPFAHRGAISLMCADTRSDRYLVKKMTINH